MAVDKVVACTVFAAVFLNFAGEPVDVGIAAIFGISSLTPISGE
jgi:hypothetical protein